MAIFLGEGPLSTESAAHGAEARAARLAAEPFIVSGTRNAFFRGSGRSLREIWARRELLAQLTRREVVARYRNSALGLLWSLIRPLIQLLIYWFAIGVILGVQRSVPDFAIFVFIGLSMWSLFSEVVSLGTTSITSNGGIVKKVKLPAEIFPLSTVGSSLVNFGAQLLVLLVVMVMFGRFPLSANLLYAPLSIAVMLVYAAAIGMVLAAVNVYLRDVEHFVEVVLLVLFWASPIVYSFTFVHNALGGNWLEQLYLANPATVAVIGMQQALWLGGMEATGDLAQFFPPDLALRLLITLVIGVALLWLAQRIFDRLSRDFAQEL